MGWFVTRSPAAYPPTDAAGAHWGHDHRWGANGAGDEEPPRRAGRGRLRDVDDHRALPRRVVPPGEQARDLLLAVAPAPVLGVRRRRRLVRLGRSTPR